MPRQQISNLLSLIFPLGSPRAVSEIINIQFRCSFPHFQGANYIGTYRGFLRVFFGSILVLIFSSRTLDTGSKWSDWKTANKIVLSLSLKSCLNSFKKWTLFLGFERILAVSGAQSSFPLNPVMSCGPNAASFGSEIPLDFVKQSVRRAGFSKVSLFQ